MTEHGQAVLGAKVVPKADRERWEHSPAEAPGGRGLRYQEALEVCPACQAPCLSLSPTPWLLGEDLKVGKA